MTDRRIADPAVFLNRLAGLASLHRWALHVEGTHEALDRDELPDEAQQVFDDQTKSGRRPKVYRHELAGLVVIATWGDDDKDDPLMRLVCWSQCGEQKFMGVAAEWWKANNPAWQSRKDKAP